MTAESLLDVTIQDDDEETSDDEFDFDTPPPPPETRSDMISRHVRNVVHFLVDEWFLSILLGIITAACSVCMDVIIEELQHLHVVFYDKLIEVSAYLAFTQWILHVVIFTALSAILCQLISKEAVGSGIPEVKVIMHGFKMEGYLTFRCLVAKMIGLTFAIGGALPIGKEGPFVHMGAIIATLLAKGTAKLQDKAFFSNEGREMEMLSSGCAVGIACTFSAPIGAVLYAIESTSRYFAVRNYWRSFLAATCSAIVFRFANFVVTKEQSGTITAFYQTSFPTDCFVIEELAVFLLMGILSGFLAAAFIFTHRRLFIFRQRNRVFKFIFRNHFLTFTLFMALVVGLLTYPEGYGRLIAGKLTFRETMADFFNNCSFFVGNGSERRCGEEMLEHWTGGPRGGVHIFTSLSLYLVTYFILVAICISINVPTGVFVPSFIIGAASGRLVGELMEMWFPDGLRGVGGPHIHPGLYAIVGAASYTGAVTHTLSVSIIICELTGQLTPILPVLIAMLAGNAICKFLQPSIYESIIRVKKYPYLPDLPPSRLSVHTVKVEQLMVTDVIYITKDTTYRQLKEVLASATQLRSLPIVTDHENKMLLGSVAKWYLSELLERHCYSDDHKQTTIGRITPREFFRRPHHLNGQQGKERKRLVPKRLSNRPLSRRSDDDEGQRTLTGNTLLACSPLHSPNDLALPLLFLRNQSVDCGKENSDDSLDRVIDIHELVIDAAPFQLVMGSSLFKTHTLFSLLGLSHAYVSDCGKLVGVVGLKELREAMANIYVRGVVAPGRKKAIVPQAPPPISAFEESKSTDIDDNENTVGEISIRVPMDP